MSKSDIENEAQMVSLILTLGGDGSVVTIFRHGWLKFAYHQCYYIDMELCNFSLYDYINYHNASETANLTIIDLEPQLGPVVVKRNCEVMKRMANVITIGLHIARGLEFMHTNGHAHRDVKPRNGSCKADHLN